MLPSVRLIRFSWMVASDNVGGDGQSNNKTYETIHNAQLMTEYRHAATEMNKNLARHREYPLPAGFEIIYNLRK